MYPIPKGAVEVQAECHCDALALGIVLKDTAPLSAGNFNEKWE